ncbi:MAG: tetratricopeptide repeat protein [Elusimicrobiota bacterium]
MTGPLTRRFGRLRRAGARAVMAALIAASIPCLQSRGLWAESFDSMSARARLAQNNGDLPRAVRDFSRALSLWKKGDGISRKAEDFSEKAHLEKRLGEIAQAIADFSRSISLDDHRTHDRFERGALYMIEGRDSDAITDFDRAIAIDVTYKEAYLRRAQAYAALGDAAFARQDYRWACRLGLRQACDALDALAPLKRKRALRIDLFANCRAALNSCILSGQSDSLCVRAAKPCRAAQGAPPKNCCPHACLSRFESLIQDESEAQAYRETFAKARPACAGIP